MVYRRRGQLHFPQPLLLSALSLGLLFSACDKSKTGQPEGAATSGADIAAGKNEPAPGASAPLAATESGKVYEPVKFSRDNVEDVMAAAKRDGKLVFVDAWAEWCHTCLSMEAYVLSDPRLGEFKDRIQFVSVETDKPDNAEFLAQFELHTWPTFFVIEPKTDKLIGMWTGAASVIEMRDFLRQSVEAAEAQGSGKQSPALSALVVAREAHAAGDFKAAVAGYEQALAAAPQNWKKQSEVLLGYSRGLLKLQRFEACAELGLKHLDTVTGAARPIEFAKRAFTCVRKAKGSERDAQVARILEKMRGIAYSAESGMSPDDRADALNIYANALSKTRDRKGAKAARVERLKVIEEAVAAAKTLEQIRAFDRTRALSYVSVGREKEAFEFLKEREKQLPSSYEPYAIRADIYSQLGDHKQAVAAFADAIERSEGPRKFKFLDKKAALQGRIGDRAGQIATLKQSVLERKKLKGAAADERALRATERALRLLGPG